MQWRSLALSWHPEDLVFVDESGCNTTFHMRYGRALRGQRLEMAAPRNWKTNTTILGALTLNSWQAMTIEGATDTDVFDAFVEFVIVPSLRPGQIVIMDNLSVHKSANARALVEAKGCQWVFLPTYSRLTALTSIRLKKCGVSSRPTSEGLPPELRRLLKMLLQRDLQKSQTVTR